MKRFSVTKLIKDIVIDGVCLSLIYVGYSAYVNRGLSPAATERAGVNRGLSPAATEPAAALPPMPLASPVPIAPPVPIAQPVTVKPKVATRPAKPVAFCHKKLNGVGFYLTTIDLRDPQTFVCIGLPNGTHEANTQTVTHGDESFDSFVRRYPAAVVVNGTFFAKDDYKCVMGNMVSEGQSLKYSPWENYGTTLGIGPSGMPEMVTARAEDRPEWEQHWFSLTCGPRLLKDGGLWLNPELEGFKDDHVLGIGPRAAIGFPKSKDKLYLVTFTTGMALDQEAKIMKAIGCSDAMNLDGGASKALAHEGKIIVKPGRALTNVLVVYDVKHPAPKNVLASLQEFRNTHIMPNISLLP